MARIPSKTAAEREAIKRAREQMRIASRHLTNGMYRVAQMRLDNAVEEVRNAAREAAARGE